MRSQNKYSSKIVTILYLTFYNHETSTPFITMVLIVTPRMMLENGLAFIGYNVRDGVDAGTWDRRFRGHYGSDPLVYSKLFEDLQTTPIVEARIQEDKISLHYFLMTVYFLRHYPTELVVESVFKVSEKTARTWIWFYVAKIKELKRQKVRY